MNDACLGLDGNFLNSNMNIISNGGLENEQPLKVADIAFEVIVHCAQHDVICSRLGFPINTSLHNMLLHNHLHPTEILLH